MAVVCQDFHQMRLDFVTWLSDINKATSSNVLEDHPVNAQLEAIKARAELLSAVYQSEAECTGFFVNCLLLM